MLDAGLPDAGEPSADAGAPDAGSSCPKDWVCPKTPLYESKIGLWYGNIWRGSFTPSTPGYAEVFPWSVSRYQPSVGFYDADDPTVFNTHLESFNQAGVDFLIVDGTNGYSYTLARTLDVMIHEILKRPAEKRVKVSVSLGASLWASPQGSPTAVTNHQNEVNLVFRDTAGNATTTFSWAKNLTPAEPIQNAYFEWKSKPLVVVYNTWSPGSNGLTWSDARFTVRNAGSIVRPNDPVTQSVYGQYGWWGWVPEYPQRVTEEQIAVTPGADNVHRGCQGCDYVLPRENGLLFMREWIHAIKNKPQAIVIGSWNDFVDENAIEPASPIPGRGAPAYFDAYGAEVPNWYLQIATAYARLRTGLMPNVVYRDEDATQMYRVKAGALVPEAAMPHGAPVILLPKGTLKTLLTP